MAQTPATSPAATTPAAGTTSTDVATRAKGPLDTDQGRTTIADTVVSKIAGIATREISGVHALGGSATRAVGALRERIPGAKSANLAQGVTVEVGERQAAIDIDIVSDYGVSIIDLAGSVRENVISSVERTTGLEVTEVNITVHDVFLETDEDETTDDVVRRVQ